MRAIKKMLLVAILFFYVSWPSLGMEEQNPIFDAIRDRDFSALKKQASKTEHWQHALNDQGQSPLLCAVQTGDPAVVEILLKNGARVHQRHILTGRNRASVSQRSGFHDTAIGYLVWKEDFRPEDLEMVNLLLYYGAREEMPQIERHIRRIKKQLGINHDVIASPPQKIPGFARALYTYMCTHIHSADYEQSKSIWPVIGNGLCFAQLVKETLSNSEGAMNEAVGEMLDEAGIWFFCGVKPSPQDLKAMFDVLEAVLSPEQVLRFGFVLKERFARGFGTSAPSMGDEGISGKSFSTCVLVKDAFEQYRKKPSALAEDLFIIEHEIFLSISTRDFFRNALRLGDATANQAQTHYADALDNFVIITILLDFQREGKEEQARRRAVKTGDFWLLVAERLYSLGDFFTTYHILSALESPSLDRLGIGLSNFSKRERLQAIIDKLSSKERFAKYLETKAHCLEKGVAFIPLCVSEANTFSINSDISDTLEKFRGHNVFNVEKSRLFYAYIKEWDTIRERLQQLKLPKGDAQHRAQLKSSVIVVPNRYPRYLSYTIRPPAQGTEWSERKILPLWTQNEFEECYCAKLLAVKESEYTKYCGVIERALHHGLTSGLPIFYAFLRTKRKTAGQEIPSWQTDLFSHMQTYLPFGILGGIAQFDRDESGMLFSIHTPPDYRDAKTAAEFAGVREIAAQRFIIYLVKRELESTIVPLLDWGVSDCESFVEKFGPLVEERKDLECGFSFSAGHEQLKALGIDAIKHRLKLKTLLFELLDLQANSDESKSN